MTVEEMRMILTHSCPEKFLEGICQEAVRKGRQKEKDNTRSVQDEVREERKLNQ